MLKEKSKIVRLTVLYKILYVEKGGFYFVGKHSKDFDSWPQCRAVYNCVRQWDEVLYNVQVVGDSGKIVTLVIIEEN